MDRLLIIGCGNEFAGDDAVGVEIARRAAERFGAAFDIRPMPRAALELLETLSGHDRVVLIDAVSSGAAAGSVHVVCVPGAGIIPRSLGGLSTHGFGLAEVLGFAERLGRPMPRIGLIGIEIRSARPGAAMGPEVAGAADQVVADFEALVASALAACEEGVGTGVD